MAERKSRYGNTHILRSGQEQTALNPEKSQPLKFMAKKKTPVRVDPKRPKRKRKRGKGKSIKKSS
jgi:hypothetical protein